MSICDNLIDLSSPLPQECAAVQPTASLGLEQLSLDPAPILLTPPVIKQQQTPRLLDTDVLEVKDQPCLLVEQSHASAMEIEEEEVRPQQMEQAAMTSEGQPAQADSPSVACTSGPSQPVAPAESSVQASAQTSSLQPAGPSSAADEQEVVKLKDELSQVVANRDALAREIGEQRATVSKVRRGRIHGMHAGCMPSCPRRMVHYEPMYTSCMPHMSYRSHVCTVRLLTVPCTAGGAHDSKGQADQGTVRGADWPQGGLMPVAL